MKFSHFTVHVNVYAADYSEIERNIEKLIKF